MPIITRKSSLPAEPTGRPSSIASAVGYQRKLKQAKPEDVSGCLGLKLARPEGKIAIRRAVFQLFCSRNPASIHTLECFTPGDWRALIPWLHTSGLALYFLDRLKRTQLAHLLPDDVKSHLEQNLLDNVIRTAGMMKELAAIRHGLEAHGLPYAVLKGCSLTPHSVPNQELRHQFDLDFLIAESGISDARHVLEQQGYRLYAISGRSWEFKKDEKIGLGLTDFYKDQSGRTVELHLQSNRTEEPSALARAERRRFGEIEVNVLSPVDLFLGQAMHAYKHLRGEFTRASHLLEFYRHVQARRSDSRFWSELRFRAERSREASLGLGIVTLLMMSVMNVPAPRELTQWTVDILPLEVRRWVRSYGDKVVFADVPGSKLYLLLERALEPSGCRPARSHWEVLLPHRPPPIVIRSAGEESIKKRVRRYRLQLKYLVIRLRFHVAEGLRYGWEARQWSKRLDGVEQ